MNKMNFTDNQTAFEYAMYMMMGSYFDKAICKNRLLERKMHVQYIEQKEKNQIQMEDICIRFIEQKLLSQLPEELWEQQVEVQIVPTELKGVREIRFLGPEYTLYAKAIYRGKGNTTIHCAMRGGNTVLIAA